MENGTAMFFGKNTDNQCILPKLKVDHNLTGENINIKVKVNKFKNTKIIRKIALGKNHTGVLYND